MVDDLGLMAPEGLEAEHGAEHVERITHERRRFRDAERGAGRRRRVRHTIHDRDGLAGHPGARREFGSGAYSEQVRTGYEVPVTTTKRHRYGKGVASTVR